ncbi:MAG TPA: Gfo/Idh/MocA family oxidoreductase [Myxococcota bacterium]|nr:Gfo/Idh/MocA family oxidoreductase [Myxococcota bacterium]
MSERLRVAVVGLGIGFQHLGAYRKLSDRFEIAAVCDADRSRAELAQGIFRVPFATADFDALLARDGVDVVDVCTPPGLHVPMVRAALASGRHAICEKPLAGSLADVDELAACEAASRGRLLPIFQYRFGRGVARLRRLVAEGVAGRCYLATVETAWRRTADYYAVPWRGRFDTELGGVCTSHAIHAHDLLYSLCGPARSVHARLATRVNPIETEDCAVVSLELASGALAALSATLGSAREISRLRLCFEHLTAESSLEAYAPGAEPWTLTPASADAARRIEECLAGFDPGGEGFVGQLAAFHAALASDAPLPVGVADARAALELVTAIYHSADTGAAVALPIGPGHPKYAGFRPAEGAIHRADGLA